MLAKASRLPSASKRHSRMKIDRLKAAVADELHRARTGYRKWGVRLPAFLHKVVIETGVNLLA
jgi:hypothetical protein